MTRNPSGLENKHKGAKLKLRSFKVVKQPQAGRVAAITGATISSEAVVRAVEQAVSVVIEAVKGDTRATRLSGVTRTRSSKSLGMTARLRSVWATGV